MSKLSNREKKIVNLILEEQSNPQLSKLMQCGISTIKTHLRIIFAKTGTHSRISLIRKYYEDPDLFGLKVLTLREKEEQRQCKSFRTLN